MTASIRLSACSRLQRQLRAALPACAFAASRLLKVLTCTPVQAFAGEYELVAMDMRGYGGSDAPKASQHARMHACKRSMHLPAHLPTCLLL